MTSLAVQGSRTTRGRHTRPVPAADLALAAAPAPAVAVTDPAVAARLDRELDLVVSAVHRQRPATPAGEVALLVAAVAADLAARHPVDGYFPVLVHGAVLTRLPC